MRIAQVETTLAARADAAALARHMVTARLAACAQIATIESVYLWDGAVHAAPEWRATFKTTTARSVELIAAIRAHHRYALPEILVTAVEASADYGRWVAASVAPLDPVP